MIDPDIRDSLKSFGLVMLVAIPLSALYGLFVMWVVSL